MHPIARSILLLFSFAGTVFQVNSSSSNKHLGDASPPPRQLMLSVGCDLQRPCVSVHWLAPLSRQQASDTTVRGYRIRYQLKGPPRLLLGLAEIPSSLLTEWKTVESRLPYFRTTPGEHLFGATYQFKVAATFEEGVSGEVGESITIHEAAPSDAPSNLHITDGNESSISLAWSPPKPQYWNGNLTYYQLRCQRDTDQLREGRRHRHHDVDDLLMINVTQGRHHRFQLTSLASPATYSCLIRAWTLVGSGPWSNRVKFKIESKEPRPPRRVQLKPTSPTSLLVGWDPPPPVHQTIQAYIIYYHVHATGRGVKPIWHHQTVPGYASIFELTGLAAYQTYVIRVASIDASTGKESLPSSSVSATLTRPLHSNRLGNFSHPTTPVVDLLSSPGDHLTLGEFSPASHPSTMVKNLKCKAINSSAIQLDWISTAMPSDEYEISVTGHSDYTTSSGLLKSVHLGQQTIHRSVHHLIEPTSTSDWSNSRSSSNLLSGGRQLKHSLVIGQLEANSHYELTVKSVEQTAAVTAVPITVICSTEWTVPIIPQMPSLDLIHLPAVNSNQSDDESANTLVEVGLTRVSELNGPLHVYCLIVAPIDRRKEHDEIVEYLTFDLLTRSRDMPSSQAPFLAYAASSDQLFTVSGRSDASIIVGSRQQQNSIETSSFKMTSADLMLKRLNKESVDNKPLQPGFDYKLALRVCSVINIDDYLCSTSPWTRPIHIPDNSDRQKKTIDSHRDNASISVHQPTSSTSTKAMLIGLVSALLFFALLSLILAGLLRGRKRRRHLQQLESHKSHLDQLPPPPNGDWLLARPDLVANSTLNYGGGRSAPMLIGANLARHLSTRISHSASQHSSVHSASFGACPSSVANQPGSPMLFSGDRDRHLRLGPTNNNSFMSNLSSVQSAADATALEDIPFDLPDCCHNPISSSLLHDMRPIGLRAFGAAGLIGSDYESNECDRMCYHNEGESQLPRQQNSYRDRGEPTLSPPSPDFATTEEFELIERDALRSQSTYSCSHATRLVNRMKNHPNSKSIPYDYNRVRLEQTFDNAGNWTDYVNASFIDGPNGHNTYIAAELPTATSRDAFWSMIWEQRCNVIVFLRTSTPSLLGHQSQAYWPNGDSEVKFADNLLVKLVESSELAYYCLRQFRLQHVGLGKQRTVYQFEYHADWPSSAAAMQGGDHLDEIQVRRLSMPFLALLRRVQTITGSLTGNGPLLVHSSPERDLTGVFLAADLAFDRIKHNQFVDLVALVQSLRRQRFNLVASPKDYQFTTQLLADIVKDGNTEIGARNLALHCQRLASCQPGKTDNWSNVNEKLLTGFQVEFAKIESTSPQLAASCPGQAIITSPQSNRRLYSNNVGDGSECSTFQCNPHASVESSKTVLTGNASCRDALMPANQVKNRFRHSIPFDFNRIRLASLRGVLGSDYINASLVDGYQRRGFFIACQSPVGGGGVDDFWRMIWQEDSRVIVTLDQLNESSSGEEFDCVRYWPSTDKRSLRFNYFVIDRLKCSDDETDSSLAHRRGNKGALVVVCDLRVTDTRDGQWRPIRQIQLDWRCEYNDKSASLVVSSDTRAQLINLVGQTHKAWARVKSHGPITVHCSSGSDRTGIFIALSNVLERLRQESVVDMYQTVKMLRFQRLGMVGSVDQYRLCYAVALDYLASFDLCSVQQDRDRMMNGHRDLGDRIDAISTHSSSSASVGNSSTGACSTVFNNATSSSAQLDRRLILGGIDDQ